METRRNGDVIVRTRYCLDCDIRWKTAEGAADELIRLRRENERLRNIIGDVRAALAGTHTKLPDSPGVGRQPEADPK